MVERRICFFCGKEIEPGTGRMFVKKDGSVLFFCTSKCFKNSMKLKRVPRRVRWTEQYRREKRIRIGVKEGKDEKEGKKGKKPAEKKTGGKGKKKVKKAKKE